MDTILALYQHGALIPAGIYALYLGLKWGSTRFAILEKPNVAHWVAIALGGLAVIAVPASQGTTPNLSMVIGAVVTALSLLAPGLASAPASKASGGFVRRDLLVMLLIATAGAGGLLYSACGASQKAAAKACEESVLKKDLTVNGIATTLGDAVENALATGTAGIPVALLGIASSLGMPLALDSISCALDLIEAAPSTAITAVTAGAPETLAQRIAAARAWVAQQRAHQ